jgi:hypothetical protein
LRDEWRLVGAAFRDRGWEAQQVRAIASKRGQPPALYVIRSKRDADELLRAVS